MVYSFIDCGFGKTYLDLFILGAIAILGPGLDPELEKRLESEKSAATAGSSQPPPQLDKSASYIASHMFISRQKLRAGSGCVSVRVSMDGPIRVIELVDIQQRVSFVTCVCSSHFVRV